MFFLWTIFHFSRALIRGRKRGETFFGGGHGAREELTTYTMEKHVRRLDGVISRAGVFLIGHA